MRLFYRNSTLVVEVDSLRDDSDTLIDGAAVTARLFARDGTDLLAGGVQLQGLGGGAYSGVVPAIEIDSGDRVELEVVAEYSGVKTTSRESLIVADRAFS